MPVTREQVVERVRADFPARDPAFILSLLDAYGSRPYDRERERVHLCILHLAAGDEDRLLKLVRMAQVDYRDVLAAAELPPLSAEEGARLQAEVRAALKAWGKDLN